MTDERPQNPYEPPTTDSDSAPPRRPSMETMVGIFFLSLFAAAATFFTTCVGTLFVVFPVLGSLGFRGGSEDQLVVAFWVCVALSIIAAVFVCRWRLREDEAAMKKSANSVGSTEK